MGKLIWVAASSPFFPRGYFYMIGDLYIPKERENYLVLRPKGESRYSLKGVRL